MFCKQLYMGRSQEHKKTVKLSVFLRFRNLRTQKLLIDCWWNWPFDVTAAKITKASSFLLVRPWRQPEKYSSQSKQYVLITHCYLEKLAWLAYVIESIIFSESHLGVPLYLSNVNETCWLSYCYQILCQQKAPQFTLLLFYINEFMNFVPWSIKLFFLSLITQLWITDRNNKNIDMIILSLCGKPLQQPCK